MEDILYDSLMGYFNALSSTGYISYNDTYKVLFLALVRDFVYNDFDGFITEDDYRSIERALYTVFGSSCLIPYPQFCNSKHIMNRLHLGSVTELVNRIKHLEEKHDSDMYKLKDTIGQIDGGADLTDLNDKVAAKLNKLEELEDRYENLAEDIEEHLSEDKSISFTEV